MGKSSLKDFLWQPQHRQPKQDERNASAFHANTCARRAKGPRAWDMSANRASDAGLMATLKNTRNSTTTKIHLENVKDPSRRCSEKVPSR